jgi:hypothetical protein
MMCPHGGTMRIPGVQSCVACTSLDAATRILARELLPAMDALPATEAGTAYPHPLTGCPHASRSPYAMPQRDGAASLLIPGAMLNGRYQVEQLLGIGSFGRVYLARDTAAGDHAFVRSRKCPPRIFMTRRSVPRR